MGIKKLIKPNSLSQIEEQIIIHIKNFPIPNNWERNAEIQCLVNVPKNPYVTLDKIGDFDNISNNIALNCARNCLRYIIKAFLIKEIYVPFYTCPVVWQSIKKENCKKEDIFLMTVDDIGKTNIIKKEN